MDDYMKPAIEPVTDAASGQIEQHRRPGGQQNLVLLNAEGEGFASSLHKGIGGCEHISSEEAFEWILSLPGKDEAILVSFFFNWDATQILRDIGTKAAQDLFRPDNYGPG